MFSSTTLCLFEKQARYVCVSDCFVCVFLQCLFGNMLQSAKYLSRLDLRVDIGNIRVYPFMREPN